MSKQKKTNSILIIFFILLFLAGAGWWLRSGIIKESEQRDIEEARKRAVDFISTRLMRGQEFKLKEIRAKEDFYILTVEVGGQEYTSYMTKDLKTFFPSGMSMGEVAGEQKQAEKKDFPKSDKPDVKLFTMSFCPYGNQAEGLMKPVVDLLGGKAEIGVHYIFFNNYKGGGENFCLDKESRYCAMHGISEAKQNIREICVKKNEPHKYWQFVLGVDDNCTTEDIEACWAKIARQTGVNVASVETCFQENALNYAKSEVELTGKSYPVQNPSRYNGQEEITITGSPTLVINGMIYSGSRSSEAYKEAICSGFKNPPQECSQTLSSSSETPVSGSCN